MRHHYSPLLQSMVATSTLAYTTSLSSACAEMAANEACCSMLLTLVKAFQRGGASSEVQQQLFILLGNILACSTAVDHVFSGSVALLANQLQITRDHEVRSVGLLRPKYVAC